MSLISVIIPLYNNEKQIANTLRSVFNQTFQDFEIVIVNDGSTDSGVDIVKSIDDNRIRLIHQENQGVSAARNKGITEAQYDLIALLDADDEWKPEYLRTQYELFLKYPDCSIFACNYEFKNAAGKIESTIIRKLPFASTDGVLTNYFEVASCSHPPMWTSAVMIKKDAFLSVGGFPVGVKSGEDLLAWAKLAVRYKIAYSRRTGAMFNFDDDCSKPKRNPVLPDIVGMELKCLLNSYPTVTGLRPYISLWHKMRANMYLRLNDRMNASKEIFTSLHFNPFNYKIWVYACLLLLPVKARHKLLK